MRSHRRLFATALTAAAAAAGPLTAAGPQAAAAAAPTHTLWMSTWTGSPLCNDGREFPQAYSTPAVGDLRGDGQREVVAALPDGTVHVMDALGRELWSRQTGDVVNASPTLADLAGNGRLEVIVASNSGQVFAWDPWGNTLPGWPRTSVETNYGLPLNRGFFSSVSVDDLFGDGRLELVASALDQRTYGWYADGSPLPGFPHLVYDSALATPVLADLQRQHQRDIVTPSDSSGGAPLPGGGTAHAGGLYWRWQPGGAALAPTPNTDQVPWASPAAGNLHGDGTPIIVNGTGDFFSGGQHIDAYNPDGSETAGFPVPTGGKNFASPAVGDLYGNGGTEVVELSESSGLYAVDGFGRALPGFPLSIPTNTNGYASTANPTSLKSSPVIAPVDSAHNGIWVGDGSHLLGYDVSGSGAVRAADVALPAGDTVYSAASVADLGTGHLVAVTLSEGGTGGCRTTGDSFHLTATSLDATAPSLPGGSWPTFHGNMRRSGSNLPLAPPPAHGYWLVASDGGIFPFGSAGGYGSTGGMHLNQPIVGMAARSDSRGYWLVASDGGIFPFGAAGGYGSTGGVHLNQPIVGMTATPDGRGYWLVASDGGIFPFGDAGGFGSTGGIHLNQPIVGMAATPDGRGYWLVASDGGIFPFGDAGGYGSTGGIHLNQPIVGMAATPDGRGYWLVASDGGIFPFGDAPGYGSTGGIHLNQPIVGVAPSFDGRGYYLVARDGGIFPFGDAPGYGSTGGIHLNQPIVSMASTA